MSRQTEIGTITAVGSPLSLETYWISASAIVYSVLRFSGGRPARIVQCKVGFSPLARFLAPPRGFRARIHVRLQRHRTLVPDLTQPAKMGRVIDHPLACRHP